MSIIAWTPVILLVAVLYAITCWAVPGGDYWADNSQESIKYRIIMGHMFFWVPILVGVGIGLLL